jgi:murein L,D-transpeptidase YcbB/YkuD
MRKLINLIIVLLFFFLGCNNSKKAENKFSSETRIVSKVTHSDLTLKKANLTSYFKSFPEKESVKNEVNLFYKNRNYQFAWINNEGMKTIVSNFQNQLQNYHDNYLDNSLINSRIAILISKIQYNKAESKTIESQIIELEIVLTTTFFKYSKKVFSGIYGNPNSLDWYIPKNKKNYQILLDSLVVSNKSNSSWEPSNKYYNALKQRLIEYREIEKKGGFPNITLSKKSLSITEKDSCLLKVKSYLVLSGDLKINNQSKLFDDSLVKAVSHFQTRMGLNNQGILGQATVNEMNVPISFRIEQIIINMERLRWFPDEVENNFLLINIPEYKLHVFENKLKVMDFKVVVGKEATRTIIFKGNMSKIILNPYWNVPTSIVIKEMLPKLKKNANYLFKNNLELRSGNTIIDPSTVNWKNYSTSIPYSIRQKPGNDNALGKMKFIFPNNFSIYLHDTPARNIFNESKRAFSHGCIRVENPMKLAQYILRNNSNWNQKKLQLGIINKKTIDIQIKPILPVYIVYFTAWIGNSGEINFRKDLYNLDKQLKKEIFNN